MGLDIARLPNKLDFLRRMIWLRLARARRACPYCGESARLSMLGHKKLVLHVYQCAVCRLIFRWPLETESQMVDFYQGPYAEGEITSLPAPEELRSQSTANFQGTALDLRLKISLLQELMPEGAVLDYGCSWGYGLDQLRAAGYRAMGFEVSRERARYGRAQLGVNILDEPQQLAALGRGHFDVIFSNHVVEHLVSIRQALDLFAYLLRPKGLLFLILPNFTGKRAREGAFWSWIGEAHPIAPTTEFFYLNLPKHGFAGVRCASGPFDQDLRDCFQQSWRGEDAAWREHHRLDGDELLVVATRQE